MERGPSGSLPLRLYPRAMGRICTSRFFAPMHLNQSIDPPSRIRAVTMRNSIHPQPEGGRAKADPHGRIESGTACPDAAVYPPAPARPLQRGRIKTTTEQAVPAAQQQAGPWRGSDAHNGERSRSYCPRLPQCGFFFLVGSRRYDAMRCRASPRETLQLQVSSSPYSLASRCAKYICFQVFAASRFFERRPPRKDMSGCAGRSR